MQLHSSKLASLLHGQTIKVPDLRKELAPWPVAMNPGYQKMIPIVNERIDSLVSHPKKSKALKAADFALFAAYFWPTASFERYRILTFFGIWIFIWDDEIETLQGDVSDDFEAAQAFRRETAEYLTQSLGFSSKRHLNESALTQDPVIRSFDVISAALCEAYNEYERKAFLDEMIYFMDQSQVEQRTRLDGRIPNLAEYWTMRVGTCAVGPTNLLAAYALGEHWPETLLDNPSMVDLGNELKAMTSLINDTLSLKKELADKCILNVVPLTYARSIHGVDVQYAVDEAIKSLRVSIERANLAAKSLNKTISGLGPIEQAIVLGLIDVLKMNATGSTEWTYHSGRYGLPDILQEDGSVVIEL